MNQNENIQKVHTMVGAKPPTSKVKIGVITSLTVIMGLSAILLADDLALAMNAIQQNNVKEDMMDVHRLAEGHREAIVDLKVEYSELETRLEELVK